MMRQNKREQNRGVSGLASIAHALMASDPQNFSLISAKP